MVSRFENYFHLQFQMRQIDRFCEEHHEHLGDKYALPGDEDEKQLLYRHLLFDDSRRAMFCFAEKIGELEISKGGHARKRSFYCLSNNTNVAKATYLPCAIVLFVSTYTCVGVLIYVPIFQGLCFIAEASEHLLVQLHH